jgi:hypothetical protein
MKKFILSILFLAMAALPSFVQGQATPTPLPGCCMQASNWTAPTLGNGSGVAVDRILKRVYVTDNTAGVIKAFNYDGSSVPSFGGGAGQVTMAGAFGVAVGPCDHPGVFGITRNAPNGIVVKFDISGNTVWTSPSLPDPGLFFVCVDENGNSYVSDQGHNAIFILDPDGNQKATLVGSGTIGALNAPSGLFVEGLQLYVSDTLNDRIVQFTESGINSYNFTPTSTVNISPLSPYGMTQGLDGNFYVAFEYGNGYQVYDGQFNPIAALCAPGGTLWAAFGIAVDETGAVYVAEDPAGPGSVVKMQPCFNQPAFNNCYQGSDPPIPGAPFIFPSPAKGSSATVSYNMTGSGNVDIKIWNSNGEMVTEVTDRKTSGVQLTPVNISRFTAGVYYFTLTLKYDSGTSETSKPKAFAVVQ